MSKRKKIIIWIIIIAIIGGGIYYYQKSGKSKTEYTTTDVQRGNLSQTVSVTGEINPNTQIDLSLKNTGRLRTLKVDIGDKVKKGQQLAVIDEGTLLANLRAARADKDYQKKTYLSIKTSSEYSRNQKLAQKTKITSAEEAINAVLAQLRETTLESPIDGIIIKKEVNQGEMAVANSAILTVAEEGNLILESNIPESDIAKVKIGQKADVTFDALGISEKFEAEVFEIDPAATVIQDVVYYRVKLKMNRQDERLKAGMSNDIDIKTSERENVLIIPLRAVKTEGGQKTVEILKDAKTNTIEKRNVTLGLEGDEGMVEIISGLKGGEKVITFTKSL
jgi:HlyD family secretion protein